MTVWISAPSIYIPDATLSDTHLEVDPTYERLYDAFSCRAIRVHEEVLMPRANAPSATVMASMAVQSVLISENVQVKPELLIDCRSSPPIGEPAPTYALAALTGLNRALPFSLMGHAGAEVAFALDFLNNMAGGSPQQSIISSVQRVVAPDNRHPEGRLPLADAAAAMLVSSDPSYISGGFEVLAIAVGQHSGNESVLLRWLLEQTLRSSGLDIRQVNWSISGKYSAAIEDIVQSLLPAARHFLRDLWSCCNFGCADVLISLHRFSNLASRSFEAGSIGVIWFTGEFGAMGVALLATR